MKKLESTFLNMFLVLTLISVIAGAGLALVKDKTQQKIDENGAKKQQKAFAEVLPEGAIVCDTVKIGEDKVFPATLNGAFGGMAIEVNTNGFGGNIKMMVGFDANGTLVNYSILETAETPGLGSKLDKWFKNDEKPKSDIRGALISDGNVKVSKDLGGKYDAITAATISSRAFMTGINTAISLYQEVLPKFQGAEVAEEASVAEVEQTASDSIKTEETTL